MLERFLEMEINGGKAYLDRGQVTKLNQVDVIVFDCDGTLVDVRGSYNKAISKSVSYLIEAITGCSMRDSLLSDEVIYLFRRSGGFNEDWDTVYGAVMFILAQLPEHLRKEIKEKIAKTVGHSDPFQRVSIIRKEMQNQPVKPLDDGFFRDSIAKLKEFTQLLDEKGVESVDKSLTGDFSESTGFRDFFHEVKNFLLHPGRVGEGVIATVFEEFFCGSDLFTDTYGVENRFNNGPGLIENERVLIKNSTLDQLIFRIGKNNIGIASGSRFNPAKYALGDLLSRFNSEALIFADDIEEAERARFEKEGFKVRLKKPNPFSLFKSAQAFHPFKYALYVGDSIADGMMVREARKMDPRFLFAGVYRYSYSDEAKLQSFIEQGSDMMIPSVNELPMVLESLRRTVR